MVQNFSRTLCGLPCRRIVVDEVNRAEFLDVKHEIDSVQQHFKHVLLVPATGRMKQKLAYAVRQKNSVEIMPRMGEQHIYLLAAARRTWAGEVVVEAQTSTGNEVRTRGRMGSY